MHELEKLYEPNEELLNKIEQEIQALTDHAKLQAYLDNILNLDQQYRIAAKQLVETHGYDSEAHQNMWKKINQTDTENYFRIVAVFEKFGYPNIDSVCWQRGGRGAMAGDPSFTTLRTQSRTFQRYLSSLYGWQCR
ncbi:MAG: hypothetical protein R8G66_00710 [Cytophagales bacterium]|nr:hypothetical protein [Cytophagales bacterium]